MATATKSKPKRKAQSPDVAYRYRNGSLVPGVTAKETAVELDRIRKVHGELTPAATVDESRPKTAVLHPAFEWNDWTAAEKYREHQARHVIRSVEIVHPETGERTSKFVHVEIRSQQGDGECSYHTMAEVTQSDSMTIAATIDCLRIIDSQLRNIGQLIAGSVESGLGNQRLHLLQQMKQITAKFRAISEDT